MSFRITFSLLFLLVYACGNNAVSYSDIIENQTSHPIWFIGNYKKSGDTNLIASKDEYFFNYGTTIGTPFLYVDCNTSSMYPDTLVVKDNPDLRVTIDINNEENWQFNLTEGSLFGSGKCECRFIIKEKHIQ